MSDNYPVAWYVYGVIGHLVGGHADRARKLFARFTPGYRVTRINEGERLAKS
jgi:hypothetical protein